MTSLTNVKVKHIRPEYNNLKEWCEDGKNEYIGRKGIVFIDKERYPKNDSIWANPFKVGRDGDIDEVLKKYKKYIKKKIEDEDLFDELLALKDKNLGCWCVDKTIHFYNECDNICHGQVLMRLIDRVKIE